MSAPSFRVASGSTARRVFQGASTGGFGPRLRQPSNNYAPGVGRLRGRAVWICCASETTQRTLIAKSDIPLVYPREDFTLQLYRWAKIEAEAEGLRNFGAAFDIKPTLKDPEANEDEAELWGFDAYVLRDGVQVCRVGVYMDKEVVERYEFVGIGEDRFPVPEGRVIPVEGKALEIWKVGEESIDEDTRSVLRRFCESLSAAIATYSSFGSCFSDDST